MPYFCNQRLGLRNGHQDPADNFVLCIQRYYPEHIFPVVGHKENGESIFRYIYTDIQKELTVKLRQSIEVYQSVELTEESRMALGQWLEQWLKNIAPNIRPSTLRRYEGTVRNHIVPFMGDKPITQITGKDIKKLYDTLARQGNRTTGECLPAVLSVGFTPCSMKHWGRQNKF